MKKTYIAPCVEVQTISAQQSMLTVSSVSVSATEYDGSSQIESKERDYEADSDNFGDLW